MSAKISATSFSPPNSGPELEWERPQITSKFVTVDGTRLHFVIKGAGRPVVFIHGNPGSTQDWTRLFGPLTASHRVIVFDCPGHGRAAEGRRYHRRRFRRVCFTTRSTNSTSSARLSSVIPGGAAVALLYAITYPKEVAGVVLVAPAVYQSQDVASLLTNLPAVPVIGDAANSVLPPLFGASLVRSELKKAFSPDQVPETYLRSVLPEWTSQKKVKWYSVADASLNDCLKTFSPRVS